MRKIFVEGTDPQLKRMFAEEGYEVIQSPMIADIICLEGGADVTPELYGEVNTKSYCSWQHDVSSFGLVHLAEQFLNIPIVGICRGGQVLSVTNGGKLKQDISGHALGCNAYAGHPLEYQGKVYHVSSAHHQEAIPNTDEGLILRAPDGTVEAHMYPERRQLAFQPHPEYHDQGDGCRTLFFNLLDQVCFGHKSD